MQQRDRPDSDTGHDGGATLGELVRRTEGAQVWRRIFHALNGTLTVLVIVALDIPGPVAAALLGLVFMMLLGVDYVRLRHPAANEAFFRLFLKLASPRESAKIASSTWYVLGAVVALAVFDRHAALSGVLVLALADPAASYCGRRWGRRRFLGGSVLGSSIFFGVALVILALRHGPVVAFPAAVAITVVERRSWPLDDNLAVPPACAALVSLLEWAI